MWLSHWRWVGTATGDIDLLRAQPGVFGPVASDPTVAIDLHIDRKWRYSHTHDRKLRPKTTIRPKSGHHVNPTKHPGQRPDAS